MESMEPVWRREPFEGGVPQAVIGLAPFIPPGSPYSTRRKYIAPHIAICEFRASRSAMAERRREIVSLLPQPALAICHQKREYPERMTLAPKSGGKPN